MLRPPVLVAAALLLAAPIHAAQPQFWRLEGARDFLEGETEGLSVDSEGRLRLAPTTRLISDPESPVVWSLARDAKGALYAGTGNEGKIYRIEGGKSALFYDAGELEVNTLAVGPDGRLYAGTSPEGKVYAIDAAGKATTFFDPSEKYVWALAFDHHGNLLVATGADGKIYRVDREGKAVVLFASPETHIMCLAVDEKGNAYAGSAPSGIVYRIDSSGKVFVLLDSSYREVKAVEVAANGSVYAAFIDGKEKDEGSKPPAPTAPATLPTFSADVTVSESFSLFPPAASSSAPLPRASEPARTGPAKGAVLRILPLGEVDTLWSSSDETPHALVRNPEGVLMGTGNKGKLYQLRDDRTWTMIVGFPAEQVTALAKGANDAILVATSNPGKVHTLEETRDRRGTFTAKVKDTETVSTWGRLRWEATLPEGTEVQVGTRSGNTGTPDSTWSEWSSPYSRREGDPVASPAARFLQVRATLVGKGTANPTLDSVSTPYLQRNLRPTVLTVTVHPPGEVFQKPISVSGEMEILGLDPADAPEGRASAQNARLGLPPLTSYSRKLYQRGIQTLSWKAEDPNGDTLVYEVSYRPASESRFRTLRKGLTDSVLAWDTSTVPNGRYVVRVTAIDSPGNPEALALSGERDSAPFEIDNTPPSLTLSLVHANPDHVKAVAKDDSNPLRKAEYSIDAGRWQEVHPLDGINDSSEEIYLIPLTVSHGPHVIVVRATDALGNTGTARLEVP